MRRPAFSPELKFATVQNRLSTSALPFKGAIFEYIPTSFIANSGAKSLPKCVPLEMATVEQQKRSTSEVKLILSSTSIYDNRHAKIDFSPPYFRPNLPIDR